MFYFGLYAPVGGSFGIGKGEGFDATRTATRYKRVFDGIDKPFVKHADGDDFFEGRIEFVPEIEVVGGGHLYAVAPFAYQVVIEVVESEGGKLTKLGFVEGFSVGKPENSPFGNVVGNIGRGQQIEFGLGNIHRIVGKCIAVKLLHVVLNSGSAIEDKLLSQWDHDVGIACHQPVAGIV